MQKFHKYDLVRIAKDLGQGMSHFTADCDAIVLGSYSDLYCAGVPREGRTPTYSVYLKGRGSSSWYEEDQLTLIQPKAAIILMEWEAADEAARNQHSNLDWIFAHGPEVLEAASSATITALAACFGLTDLWGRRGEGYVAYENSMRTLAMAKPFLATGDKAGWLAHCETVKAKTATYAPIADQ